VFDKMKQLMDMRKMAKVAEQKMEEISVEKIALGGKLRITVNGNLKVKALSIDESLLSPGQKPTLEKALSVLITEAAETSKRQAATQAMEMMRGMNLGL